MQAGRADLADRVRHIAEIEGYRLDCDVSSFEVEGSELHIAVKATRGGADKDFFVSANEVEFSSRHSASYCLYRSYDFDRSRHDAIGSSGRPATSGVLGRNMPDDPIEKHRGEGLKVSNALWKVVQVTAPITVHIDQTSARLKSEYGEIWPDWRARQGSNLRPPA